MTKQVFCGRLALPCAAVLCALAMAGIARADEYGNVDAEYLLRRLDAAERRIQDLESERSSGYQGALSVHSTGQHNDVNYDRQVQTRLTRLETAYESIANVAADDAYKPPTEPTFEMGGRIHLDHWGFPEATPGIGFFENPSTGDAPEDRFAFRRVRLEMQGNILENMLWRMQIDFAETDNIAFKDVYIGWTELPYNQEFHIGIQKRPLGLDHLNSSRFNIFLERPLVVEAFNEDARRLGMAMYGYTDDELYHWRYGVYNLENIATTGGYVGDSLQLSANGRLSSSPWYDETSGGRGYFHYAVAGMFARPDGSIAATNSNNNEGRFRTRPEARSTNRWINTGRIAGARYYEILGLETILNVGAFQFVSEYQSTWLQRDTTTVGTGPDVHFHGAYAYVSYFLTGEHMAYNRKTGTLARTRPFQNFFLVDRCLGGHSTGWGAFQVAARYSYLDLTDEDIAGGVEHNYTLGMNWFWTAYSRVQFNAIYGTIDQHAPVGGFTDGDFWILGTRFAADF